MCEDDACLQEFVNLGGAAKLSQLVRGNHPGLLNIVLFCFFVLFCFVLFCFVLFCFVSFCFVLCSFLFFFMLFDSNLFRHCPPIFCSFEYVVQVPRSSSAASLQRFWSYLTICGLFEIHHTHVAYGRNEGNDQIFNDAGEYFSSVACLFLDIDVFLV